MQVAKTEITVEMNKAVVSYLSANKQATVRELADKTGLDAAIIYRVLKDLLKLNAVVQGEGDQGNMYFWTGEATDFDVSTIGVMPEVGKYYDHLGVFPALELFYSMRVPTILIGPHGSGKTEAILEFARQKGMNVYTVPCSLGLREHHFIGRLDRDSTGAIHFKEGPVPQSMQDDKGAILYLDELNAAEADVLLRMDEVLDGRKEVNIEGKVIKASPNWWCVASINPLDHAGTKELPHQLMSRFTHRINVTYPKTFEDEKKLVNISMGFNEKVGEEKQEKHVELYIKAVRALRDAEMDLMYLPSLRESIVGSKMIRAGVPLKVVSKHVLITPYTQWGKTTARKVADFLVSKLGKENVDW